MLLPFEKFKLVHPFLLCLLLFKHISFFGVNPITMLYNETVEVSLVIVMFFDKKPLHILYLFRDSTRFTFKYKDSIFVESKVAAFFIVLLLIYLDALIFDPRCIFNELWNIIFFFYFPNIIVEALEIRRKYLLMSLDEFIELIDV
jgi:hypothetical protein